MKRIETGSGIVRPWVYSFLCVAVKETFEAEISYDIWVDAKSILHWETEGMIDPVIYGRNR